MHMHFENLRNLKVKMSSSHDLFQSVLFPSRSIRFEVYQFQSVDEMGYAFAGYPTRINKRRKLKSHDELPIYYANHISFERKKQRSKQIEVEITTLNATNEDRKQLSQEPLTIQSLPPEILRNIFVLSGDYETMPLLNKYFCSILKFDAYLLKRMFFHTYIFNPFDYEIHESMRNLFLEKSLILPELFENETFTKYFANNYQEFTNNKFVLMKSQLCHDIERGTFSCPFTEEELSELSSAINSKAVDIPWFFYERVSIFFENHCFIEFFSQLATLEDVDRMLANIFDHFFLGHDTYTSETFFGTFDIVMKFAEQKSLTSPFVLARLLNSLYLEGDDPIERIMKPYETDVSTVRLTFFQKVLNDYYTEEDASQSVVDPTFVSLLKKTGDMRLIEFVTSINGSVLSQLSW